MAPSHNSAHHPQDKATDAYVFGYSLVVEESTRRLQTNTVAPNATQAPTNQLLHYDAPATPATTDVVRPNVDTLYTQCWIDLTAGPMVLEVPVMDADRYWIMEMLDAWSNVVGDPNALDPQATTAGTDPNTGAQVYSYALTGPGWSGELPAGVHQLAMPTNVIWLLGRIEIHNTSPSEISTVVGYQNLMRLLPVTAWPDNGSYVPPNGTYDPNLPTTPPSDQVNGMSGPEFFAELAALLPTTPLNPPDKKMSATLAALGVYPHDPSRLPSDKELEAARDLGLELIKNHQASEPVNGWTFTRTDIGYYGTHYLQRAYIAAIGLGANLPQDALYPSYKAVAADSTGAPYSYTLTFPEGQLPPVDGFWSLTAYDSNSFLVANDANIYAIGHYAAPVADATGATTLYVQAAPPVDAQLAQTNWLPIPASGNFSVTLRMYGPITDEILPNWPAALVQTQDGSAA
ncbi:DUF1254 domain-containing protein [Kitasatospora griseola]|uniref:DUF1254 domain-containing protein n=1 Tax=Kitasatospora griseola TaxID=2064 RepID=UPI00381C7331